MHYHFCVIANKKIRVDIYLSTLFSDFSRSYIQKMIDKGQVYINGENIWKNTKINHADEIWIKIETETLDIMPEEMELDIIYEDRNLLIINKEAGINVHPVPGEGGKKNTLVNGFLYHCKKSNNQEDIPSINGVERPGIVHRLDKETSGIILIAKTDSMMQYLSEIIKKRKIVKEYIAVVYGIVKDKKIKIESYLGRDPINRKKMTSIQPINPKIAVSEAEVIKYIDSKYTVLQVKIFTGRTHQIRVHLASIGHQILGDKVYGIDKINKEIFQKYGLQRQALHAKKLQFVLYGKKMTFEAPLKKDMKDIIDSES